MASPTVLLISGDLTLHCTCKELVDTVAGLRLAVISHIHEAETLLQRGDVALALIHLAQKPDDVKVAQLLRVITAMKRPLATLVLSDEHDEEQAHRLLRLGAADYLSLPVDRDRLAFLIDALAVRTRLSGSPSVLRRSGFASASLPMGPGSQRLGRRHGCASPAYRNPGPGHHAATVP
jgi:DNA-binding NarL/FixJ family response regulator